MAYQHWTYDTLHRFCMDAFQKFGLTEKEADIIQDVLLTSDLFGIESRGEKEVATVADRKANGIPVNDNTMVKILDLCNYLGMDFSAYFGDYLPSVKKDVFKGNYYIPYGKGHLTCPIEPNGVLTSRIDSLKSEKSGLALVEEALANPIGSKPLHELAAGKKTCTIIISDHTRPVPSKDILPPMLKQLRQGNPDIKVTLLVATGFHRLTTKDELVAKLGEEIANSETIVVHDAFAPDRNVQIGILPSGAPLVIDRVAVETDLLISEGFIEPHFFAGFSGGRKSVLPGVCDKTTVLGNHCGSFIASDNARTGILEGNPIHRDMVAAAEIAKLAFIVNVVIDDEKKTVAAFAGDFKAAHAAGVAFLRPYCEVAAIPGDIVITSNGGAPLDQNIYQSVKGLTAAEASAKEGAVLIMCADLADGIGGEGFYRSLRDCESPAALFAQFAATPQSETIPDQWESQILARILMKHRVIFVSRPEMESALREMKMEYAQDLETAIAMAKAEKGENATVNLIPNGISVMVKQ